MANADSDSINPCGCAQTVSPRVDLVNLVEPGRAPTVRSVTSRLTLADRLGAWKVRWGIGRSSYRVVPGLYAVGDADDRSPVLVTANYKLTFDTLRRHLVGQRVWVLALDTHGINVWCAAGKGTFGTAELVHRVGLSGLRERVSHRTLILPQLGAPGVAAHKVKQATGFNVVYGPIRAEDVPGFLANNMKATREMRVVTFGLKERLAVVPEELLAESKFLLLFLTVLAIWRLASGEFSPHAALSAAIPLIGAFLAGTVAVPVLLPWLPFRSFALKGWLIGLIWAVAVGTYMGYRPGIFAGSLLLLPALSSYLALNFTGSTTFTSQSGVNREIRLFARPIAASGLLGVITLIAG